MYVYQFMDGRWVIAKTHPTWIDYTKLIRNKAAFALFDRGYDTRQAAYAAMRQVESMLRAA